MIMQDSNNSSILLLWWKFTTEKDTTRGDRSLGITEVDSKLEHRNTTSLTYCLVEVKGARGAPKNKITLGVKDLVAWEIINLVSTVRNEVSEDR